jgi:hypothetical protein
LRIDRCLAKALGLPGQHRRAAALPYLRGPFVVMDLPLQYAVRANPLLCRPPSRRCLLNKCGPTSPCSIPRCVIWLSRVVSFQIWHCCSRPGSSPLQRSLGDIPKHAIALARYSCPYPGSRGIEPKRGIFTAGWSVIRTGPVVVKPCRTADAQIGSARYGPRHDGPQSLRGRIELRALWAWSRAP